MKKNYYCLVAGFPDLKPDDKKSPITWQELRDEVEESLTEADQQLVGLFYLPYDHANITSRLFQTGAAFDPRGRYSESEIDAIVDRNAVLNDDCPAREVYIASALADYYAAEHMSLSDFTALLQNGWFDTIMASNNAFAKTYAEFDNTLRNVFIALQGRKYSLDVANAIVGQTDAAQAVRTSRAHDFGLKGDVDYIDQVLQAFEIKDLAEREMRIDAMRWNFIDENSFFDYFGVEKVIGMVLKLGMVERWAALDEERGKARFAAIIAEIKESYEKSNNV